MTSKLKVAIQAAKAALTISLKMDNYLDVEKEWHSG